MPGRGTGDRGRRYRRGRAGTRHGRSRGGHVPLGRSVPSGENPRGDEFSPESVGPEPCSEASSGLETRASGPSACQDSYYNPGDAKVYGYNRWYANTGSIPDNVSKFRAVGAMKRGGTNIFKVKKTAAASRTA